MEKRKIPNCPGYKIDRKGQVWGPSGKKLKPFMDRSGAMRVNLNNVTKYPQRLVCEAFHTTKFEHKNISVRNHKYRSKKINHSERFKWGTQKQVKRSSTKSKLTPSQRAQVFKLWKNGWTQHDLADKFHVSQVSIFYIIHKKR